MARLFSGILGVSVATLALSAIHLEIASGNDLDTFQDRYGTSALIAPGTSPFVNREDKADRTAAPTLPQDASRTVAIKVEQLENTSVLIRVPTNRTESAPNRTESVPAQSPSAAPSRLNTKPTQRRMVACELVVSALTDVAKLLDPGRCVT